jgi:succinate dehydrogenase / fumarate reductase flavoprotein subunit
MGGLWVDYNLMSNIPGLYVIGEANFSDHGANRLGASALMQGLADGYFILPYTIGEYFASVKPAKPVSNDPEFRGAEEGVREKLRRLLSIGGRRTVREFHRELGRMMWNQCGMARNEAGLKELLERLPQIRQEFWEDVNVLGGGDEFNQSLEYAARVADFLEFAELLTYDALQRNESCGGHFREEYQTEDGEALRNDDEYSYVAAWQYAGSESRPVLHKEPLVYEEVHMTQRSYK